jgi:hypothetical protein
MEQLSAMKKAGVRSVQIFKKGLDLLNKIVRGRNLFNLNLTMCDLQIALHGSQNNGKNKM